MCQGLRTQWKVHNASSQLGSNWLAQVVKIPASAQCFSYCFSCSLTAHPVTSDAGLEIRASKRQAVIQQRKRTACMGVPVVPVSHLRHKAQEIHQNNQLLSTGHSCCLWVHSVLRASQAFSSSSIRNFNSNTIAKEPQNTG